ncbi:MAG TPA: nitrite reductase, partial [Microbacteriaceae bacterium]|nr:nitrite reductase [Microbacteriaceae bacterium]
TGSAGTPRLFLDRFAHPDGRARIVAVRSRSSAPRQPGTLTLVTGRLLEHYQSGSQTRRVPELVAAQPVARMQLHPATADRLAIDDGAEVELSNARGTVRCVAEVTPDIRPDTVFLPFHFAGDESANLLTSDATDPVSGMPEFKRTIVTVRAVAARTDEKEMSNA